MNIRFTKKIKQCKGTSRIVFIFSLIALFFILMICIPIIWNGINGGMDNFDDEQLIFAERQANLIFQQNHKAFEGVFDTETKKFVNRKKARTTVTPYGTSKEHQGMYILITVDEDGKISSEWISP